MSGAQSEVKSVSHDRSPAAAPASERPARVRLEEAIEIATEAYVYAYPLVLMEITRRISTNVETPVSVQGAPINQFAHVRRLPHPVAGAARPNVDMLYSKLWLDLTREPIVVHVPDSLGRHFLLPLIDMWTNVFASPGARTSGMEAQRFAVVGPNWRGSLPAGVDEVRSPTTHAWLHGHIAVNGASDYAGAHRFQDALTAMPLSQIRSFYRAPKGRINSDLDIRPAVQQVAKLSGARFFSFFLEATRLDRPHVEDSPILARMKRLGLEPGKPLDFESLPLTVRSAVHDAPKKALPHITDAVSRVGRIVNGWSVIRNPVGTYGADYTKRAALAHASLGANTLEDILVATLDERTCKQTLDGAGHYRLHFETQHIPPARAFWSLTMYNSRGQLATNRLDRYAIGDRDSIQTNADGSIDVYLQRESPGKDKEANWLPTPPNGAFSLALRLYWPKQAALDGSWSPPPILKFR